MFHQLENSLTNNEPTKDYNNNNNKNNDSNNSNNNNNNNNNNYLTPGPFHDSSSTSRCAFQRLSQNPQWLTRKTQRQMAERKSPPNCAPFRPTLEWWLWNTEIDISLKECYSNRRAAHCKKINQITFYEVSKPELSRIQREARCRPLCIRCRPMPLLWKLEGINENY